MIRAGSQFHTSAWGCVLRVIVRIRARASMPCDILPAQHGARAQRASQNPSPIIRRDLLVRLAAQIFKRGKNRTQHDFEQRGMLVVTWMCCSIAGRNPARVTLIE